MTRVKWVGIVGLLIIAATNSRNSSHLRASAPDAFPPTTYNAIDLGTLGGGAYSFAHAMNDSSVVVGRSYTTAPLPLPFIWQNGVMTQLDLLPGATWGEANDINESGVVVGISRTPSSGDRPTLWVGGVPTELARPADGGAVAYGINEAGDVVGQADFQPFQRAALWQGGVLTNLGALPNGSRSEARAINNVGQIVGSSYSGDGRPHAVLWQNGTIVDLTPTAYSATAIAINDSGLVVGALMLSAGEQVNRAFYWQNGILTVIDPVVCSLCSLGSYARDVNEAGVIAIEAGTITNAPTAFLLFNGELTALPGTRGAATAVNNAGQAAGYLGNGHAILWDPDPVTTSLVANVAAGTFRGSASLSATLTVSSGAAVTGQTVTFSLFGATVGDAITDANGVATIGPVSLVGHAAATYPGGLQVSFDGTGQYLASSGEADLTITEPRQSSPGRRQPPSRTARRSAQGN